MQQNNLSPVNRMGISNTSSLSNQNLPVKLKAPEHGILSGRAALINTGDREETLRIEQTVIAHVPFQSNETVSKPMLDQGALGKSSSAMQLSVKPIQNTPQGHQIIVGTPTRTSFSETNDRVKNALADYEKTTTTLTDKALRHAQAQWDRMFKMWVNLPYSTEVKQNSKSLMASTTEEQTIRALNEEDYGLLLTGLQQRLAVEKTLKTFLSWDFSSSEEECFRSVLYQWYQKIDSQLYELHNEKELDLAKVSLLYNLRVLLLDAAKTRSYWEKFKRSIKIGEFQMISDRLYPKYSGEGLQRLSEMTPSQLVICFNNAETALWQKTQIRKLMVGIIEYFRQTKVRTAELIAAVIPLAVCQDDEIRHHLLEAFIKPIRESLLLDSILVHGLAQVIRYAYAIEKVPPNDQNANPLIQISRQKESDNLWQVLGVLFERVAKLHSQKGDTEKLAKLLDALIAVLNAMVDQGITGLAAEKALFYSQQLRGLDTHDNSDIQFQVAYARQALARVPDDTSMFMKYFGCSVKIVGSVIAIAKGAALMDPR